MLTLKNIKKTYSVGGAAVEALKGIDISFRENEFVAVLGPSGCGKTTMLNIIGGLDNYTDGDLQIAGVSTKEYNDSDWDSYRNHSIGFVFQSYNLIPHQSVLSNVELALTLSGVPRAERRRRAREVLEKVGLGDQISRKPNQMSGGQMQRVAIARALVNNPQILLADEPTGALDQDTGIQLMEMLKEVAKDRLVIMVTHNPELAEKYATRTVRLLDGNIIDDSDPYFPEQEVRKKEKEERKAKRAKKRLRRRHSMSFLTALNLSLNNLFTKRTRTALTSFAGSIGIIGIALILAMSSGATSYIHRVEKDTLSSYPITIEDTSVDVTALMETMAGKSQEVVDRELDRVYSQDMMTGMMQTLMTKVSTNDLKSFKKFIESKDSGLEELTTDIQYTYDIVLNLYKPDGSVRVNPSNIFKYFGMGDMMGSNPMAQSSLSNADVWRELLSNKKLLSEQYEVVAGDMPKAFNEAIIVIGENNELSDYTLYTLGLKDPKELEEMFAAMMAGKQIEEIKPTEYSYDELLGLRYKLLLNSDYYDSIGGKWIDRRDDALYIKQKLEGALEVKIVGIVRPAENAIATAIPAGTIGYTAELTEYLINEINKSEIVKAQKANPDVNILTGMPFSADKFDISMLTAEEQAYLASLSEEERAAAIAAITGSMQSSETYETMLIKLGGLDIDTPSGINIYPKDFESKDAIEHVIQKYNEEKGDAYAIKYTDYIGLLLSSVTTIINAITYILIAFVSVSLIVSSIMIGIITYISVLERRKEIGILRSIGASKKDVSRVFNAETLIVGFGAGMMGIIVTLLVLIPANLILKSLTDIANLAYLPVGGAIFLVAISMLLTFVAGLIPSRIAAKKDPVEALRSE